ncbi:MAG TPA: nuclear transport factor 2 family protein [Asticcacaulis sp.]|nr:nuclear transport factor 2 family protein [Asticcacaulis sp.]
MNWKSLVLSMAMATGAMSGSALAQTPAVQTQATAQEQEIIALSRQKWLWMAERNTDALGKLFDDKAVFVHMGGTMSRTDELGVISGGMIQYKRADIEQESARFIGDTAIVLSKIRLLAVVGGNEVTNPFMVTEVYVRVGGEWKLGSLSFTRLMGD